MKFKLAHRVHYQQPHTDQHCEIIFSDLTQKSGFGRASVIAKAKEMKANLQQSLCSEEENREGEETFKSVYMQHGRKAQYY